MTKVRIIRPGDRNVDLKYEPPLSIGKGIESATVGVPIKMSMARVVIPPGGRNQRHYHINTDTGFHLLKGRLKWILGPDHEMEEVIVEAGDFVYVPRGEIHGLINLSNTEPAEAVATANSAGSTEEGGTMYIEPVWK
jgi:uncharacterized RmlC-like cupin family protein